MPRRMSSRDRLDRLRAEREAEEREKEEKRKVREREKAVRPRSSSSRKKVAASVRMKMVWAVCRLGGDVVETYPYPRRSDAEEHAARLNRTGRGDHIVRPEKVPME